VNTSIVRTEENLLTENVDVLTIGIQANFVNLMLRLGVPLICVIIIILCCFVCRLDLCPRRSSGRSMSI
jgi:hypothetical protein